MDLGDLLDVFGDVSGGYLIGMAVLLVLLACGVCGLWAGSDQRVLGISSAFQRCLFLTARDVRR